ncbi:hypothetical protein PHSY_001417 [Pseudozyma hubeiensis SY62]|uniref:Uncharacterized protein n=1 Tax=Pseudozyma hubeiensis (strain SY62) TaxID=1305764 RepID=R9NYT7_PSEHS|nr:hypothetical protein PHSY_001417 [Pseudozyma hubeiensis SY62]GAC93851.1 hypothetical protein PHSY_001417 [Pseudozyma hubeiensis SY62]
MSIGPIGSSEPLGSPASSSSSAVPFEPYQSAAFQPMRTRMQSLSTASRHASATAFDARLTLSAAERFRRQGSTTPSPPISESSSRVYTSSRPETPLSQASDSSAGSCADVDHPSTRYATVSPTFSHLATPMRPSLASKRLLSDGDVIPPRPIKKSRLAARRRSLHTPSSALSGSIVTSWRSAREQSRRRQMVQRDAKRQTAAASTGNGSLSSTSASTQPLRTQFELLPELRLLSATRTAPIAWSPLADSTAFEPHMVESHDELAGERAPERLRFWPIVDRQLDHTSARMLSLSNPEMDAHQPMAPMLQAIFEAHHPVSPKSSLPLPRCDMLVFPAYTQPIGSSDEDLSPATPDAPIQRGTCPSPRCVSRWARHVVATESQRQASIALTPSATLSAVVDFTRGQAGDRKHGRQAFETTRSPPRNAHGQLIYSPPSPHRDAAHCARPDLAAHAPLRIAPRRHAGAAAAASVVDHRSKDYFGRWETYVCNYGKESTF